MSFSEINKIFIILDLCLDSLQLNGFHEQTKLKAIVISREWVIWPGFRLCWFCVSRWVFCFAIFISKKSQSTLTSVGGLSTHITLFPTCNERPIFFLSERDDDFCTPLVKGEWLHWAQNEQGKFSMGYFFIEFLGWNNTQFLLAESAGILYLCL